MQIQISWLLQKPTDLDLHCLQRQGISRFSMTRFKIIVLYPKTLTEKSSLQVLCIDRPYYGYTESWSSVLHVTVALLETYQYSLVEKKKKTPYMFSYSWYTQRLLFCLMNSICLHFKFHLAASLILMIIKKIDSWDKMKFWCSGVLIKVLSWWSLCSCLACWVKISADSILKYFSQKITFDISCKECQISAYVLVR